MPNAWRQAFLFCIVNLTCLKRESSCVPSLILVHKLLFNYYLTIGTSGWMQKEAKHASELSSCPGTISCFFAVNRNANMNTLPSLSRLISMVADVTIAY